MCAPLAWLCAHRVEARLLFSFEPRDAQSRAIMHVLASDTGIFCTAPNSPVDSSVESSTLWCSSKCMLALALRRTGDGNVGKSPFDANDASSTQPIAPQASVEHAPLVNRRAGDANHQYAVQCWGTRSAFTDRACNCLSGAAQPKLGSRPTIKIVVGSWYVRCEVH